MAKCKKNDAQQEFANSIWLSSYCHTVIISSSVFCIVWVWVQLYIVQCTRFSLHILPFYGHHKLHMTIWPTQQDCCSVCFQNKCTPLNFFVLANPSCGASLVDHTTESTVILRHVAVPHQHLFWHGITMVKKEVYVVFICQDVCCPFGKRRKKPGKINILSKETAMRTSLLSKHMGRVRRADFLQLSTHHTS